MNKKVPLVLWSGGLDSTYLLWCLLSNNTVCDVLYVNVQNNTNMIKQEQAAIKKLKSILKKADYSAHIRNELTYDVPVRSNSSQMTLPQAAIWSEAILWNFNPNKHSHIEIGYVKGDDFWHYKEAISLYQNHMFKAFLYDDVQIKYPLEWTPKEEIIKEFKNRKVGIELLKHIRYCEISTTKTPCGKCPSCKKHIISMYSYEIL